MVVSESIRIGVKYTSNIKAFEAILQCGTKIYTEIRVLRFICVCMLESVTLPNLVSMVLLLKYNLFRYLAKQLPLGKRFLQ